MKNKKLSNRVPLKQQFNIQKKIKNHNKRIRKMINKGALKKRFHRKDPGIPNLFPFKAEMLQQIRKQQQEAAEEKQRKRDQARDSQKNFRMKRTSNSYESAGSVAAAAAGDLSNNAATETGEDSVNMEAPELVEALDDSNQYELMRQKAEAADAVFGARDLNDGSKMEEQKKGSSSFTKSTNVFYRRLRELIEKADVLVEVLDCREPMGCRNVELESEILSKGKKLILLLNKIDLVPKEAVEAWLSYLRQSFPTVAFKSALSSKSSRVLSHSPISTSQATEAELNNGSQVFGASSLIQMLKNYSRVSPSNATKVSISVGLIGMPNVGKSSVINSLCRNAAGAKVGGEAGVTRELKEIQLDSQVQLIDSPGVIMSGSNNSSDLDLVLRNSVKIASIQNPIEIVEDLLKKFPTDQIMRLFKVQLYKSASQFLAQIARSRGKLSKGGVLDYEAAAKAVLTDWATGKIRHHSLPPEMTATTAGADEANCGTAVAKTAVAGTAVAGTTVANDDKSSSGSISGIRFVARLSEPFKINS